ncbi:hypothetical protein K501DRAFT_272220 [Backusella circina FSU 941]|nr:hypothetical protein K501DRAFT_272220 [Backusella circina FSU 941]
MIPSMMWKLQNFEKSRDMKLKHTSDTSRLISKSKMYSVVKITVLLDVITKTSPKMCFFHKKKYINDDDASSKGWEEYVYGSDGESTSVRSSSSSSNNVRSSPSNSIRSSSNIDRLRCSPSNSLRSMPNSGSFQSISSLRFENSRSPSARSLAFEGSDRGSDLYRTVSERGDASSRVSPISFKDVRTESQADFMKRFSKRLEESTSNGRRY